MPKYSPALDRTFHALGDPTRRAIVERLARGPASLSELREPFAMSLPAIHQHVAVLTEAGLVGSAKQGRVRYCHLEGEALAGALTWIEQRRSAWEQRLDALGRHLSERTLHDRLLPQRDQRRPAPDV